MRTRERAFDIRVGGRDVAEGTFHNRPVSQYEATYTDIVEHVRIVTTYGMWLDGVHWVITWPRPTTAARLTAAVRENEEVVPMNTSWVLLSEATVGR
jgi:uncharacterized protein YndB with AHSA1/START domain